MKKFIYSLSVAMAFGVAANAASPAMMQKVSTISPDVQTAKIGASSMIFERISDDTRKAKRGAATSAQDFVGNYRWSGRNQLSSVVYPNEGVMTIEIDERDPSKILIYGFDPVSDPGLEAYFDSSKGRLYIPNQYITHSDYYNLDIWFVNWTVYNGETEDGEAAYGLMQAPDENQFFFTLTPEGNIQAGDVDANKWDNHLYTDEELMDNVCIACALMPDNDAGYFWMCFGIKGTLIEDFQFIEDEWQYLGEADFTDAWFRLYWQDYIAPTYEVPLYYDKSNPGRYILNNPYGCGSEETNPYLYNHLNISDKPGYLIFNITDPECIVFEPSIYAMSIDFREAAEDPELPQAIYCYNYEGYSYYISNAEKEEIILYCEQNDMETSWLNQRTNEISVNNALISLSLNTDNLAWTGIPMSGSIVLPGNYMDGVDSILGEENAPVQYYNLQGVRVANPEKGQIVIVRKGDKAVKQIVR